MSMKEVDGDFIIRECFLGYQYRKVRKQLYQAHEDIPKKLIALYFSNPERADLDYLKDAFIKKYIKNECALEDVHSKEEKTGMKIMYEYMHTTDDEFSVYSILDYHRMLYSTTPFPECAGHFRNYDVYLPGTGTELSEWSMIWPRIKELELPIRDLIKNGSKLKNNNSVDKLFEYIKQCVILKCTFIKIHPFPDGNGRTIRCFLNKLFEIAGIPPVYIKENEKTEYHRAMNQANLENNYDDIIKFYYYKICDSIVELDINQRLRDEKQIDFTDIEGRQEHNGNRRKI